MRCESVKTRERRIGVKEEAGATVFNWCEFKNWQRPHWQPASDVSVGPFHLLYGDLSRGSHRSHISSSRLSAIQTPITPSISDAPTFHDNDRNHTITRTSDKQFEQLLAAITSATNIPATAAMILTARE